MTAVTGRNRNETQDRIIEELRKAGRAGALSTVLAGVIGRDKDTAHMWIKRLADAGIVASWPDPYLRCQTRKRFWLAEFRPEKCPKPSLEPSGVRMNSIEDQRLSPGWRSREPVQVRNGVQTFEPWTHDTRFQLAPGEKPPPVIDGRECDTWAIHAAAAVGSH